MHVAARARLVLARRPWLYWAVVGTLATGLATGVHDRLAALERARHDWGATRSVLVAERTLGPGDPAEVRAVELPIALVPPDAVSALDEPVRLRQRIGEGEVLTVFDITVAAGPAGRAPAGTVVVALSDPLSGGIGIGLPVQVAADGLVIAESATVVETIGDVVFLAVAPSEGPMVAAAAHQGTASLLYLP
jgi:hypothetical protein